MTPQELEAFEKDPHNRKWGVYYCKADPRVIVPKRFKWMGWTINAARPSAIPVVLLVVAIVAVPVLIGEGFGRWEGRRVGYDRGQWCDRLPVVRLFVIKQTMESLTPNQPMKPTAPQSLQPTAE